MNESKFKKTDLENLKIVWSLPADNFDLDFVAGDVLGGKSEEMIVYDSREIRILDINGHEVGKLSLEDATYEINRILLQDIDGDGKQNIIIGTANDTAARLLAYDGLFNLINEITYGQIYKAETGPLLARGGSVIISAQSAINIGPKYLCSFDIVSGDLKWSLNLPFVVLTASFCPRNGNIAVSHFAPAREYPDYENYWEGEFGYHYKYVVDSSGNPEMTKLREYPLSDVNFNLANPAFVINEYVPGYEGPVILTAEIHDSAFYPGKTTLFLSGNNNEITEKPFSGNSGLDVFPYAVDGRPRFYCLETRSGKLTLLDREFAELYSYKENETNAWISKLHSALRYDGLTLIVSRGTRVYFFDEECRVKTSIDLPSKVVKVLALPDEKSRVSLAVLADKLYFFSVSNDLGVKTADSKVDANFNGVMPQYEAEGALAVVGEAPFTLPGEGYGFYFSGNILAGKKEEFIFANPSKRKLYLYSFDSREYSSFYTDCGQIHRVQDAGDLDGDGFSELFIAGDFDKGFGIYRPDGTPLRLERPCNGYDSDFTYTALFEDSFYLGINTGYLLQPRGIAAYDTNTWDLKFYHPLAEKLLWPVAEFMGAIYFSAFTPHNGAEIIRRDGSIEDDSQLILPALYPDGSPAPAYQKLPGSNSYLNTVRIDLDDGPVLLTITSNHFSYYPGVPRIYCMFEGDPKPVFKTFGPENAQFYRCWPVWQGEKQYILIWWNDPDHTIIYALPDFKQVFDFTGEEIIEVCGVTDFNRDGYDEIVVRGHNSQKFIAFDGALLWKANIPNVSRAGCEDLDSDGSAEFFVITDRYVQVFNPK